MHNYYHIVFLQYCSCIILVAIIWNNVCLNILLKKWFLYGSIIGCSIIKWYLLKDIIGCIVGTKSTPCLSKRWKQTLESIEVTNKLWRRIFLFFIIELLWWWWNPKSMTMLKVTKRDCKSTVGLEQGSSGIEAFKDQEEKSNWWWGEI